MKDFFLIATAIVLAIIPLQFVLPSSIFQGAMSPLWDVGELLCFFVLLIFYAPTLVSQKNILGKLSVYLACWLSIILGVAMISAVQPSAPSEVLRWLLIIWCIPFIQHLKNIYGGKMLLLLMITIITLHAQWGIAQFFLQQDFNLYLIGETRLAVDKPGIAKFAVPLFETPTKIIRAYGPYPHPNILAAATALGFSAALLLAQTRRHHVFTILQVVLIVGTLVTFSRTALLSIGSTLLILLILKRHITRDQKRFTPQKWAIVLLTLLVFIPLWWFRQIDQDDVAIPERLQGITWVYEIATQQQFRGIGLGRYQDTLEQHLITTAQPYAPWQIAPVHSAPLLLLAEWGIVPLLMLVLTGTYGLWRLGIQRILWLIPLLPLLFFDHYLATATAPLLWVVWWWLALVPPAPKPRLSLAKR